MMISGDMGNRVKYGLASNILSSSFRLFTDVGKLLMERNCFLFTAFDFYL